MSSGAASFTRTPDGETHQISVPNEYRDVALTERCAILKIHGAVSRGGSAADEYVLSEDGRADDSYVITEDDYITFLAHADISGLVPVTLAGKLRKSNFLFLGYGLRDWNLRVILHRIWTEQMRTGTYSSWAIQLDPEELDQKFWQKRDVEVIDMRLDQYLELLRERLGALRSGGSGMTEANGQRDSPYQGLAPYDEGDAAFFFGRDRERDLITANLMASRLTVLYGVSGVGKSSVLRAGAAHHLHALASPRTGPSSGGRYCRSRSSADGAHGATTSRPGSCTRCALR